MSTCNKSTTKESNITTLGPSRNVSWPAMSKPTGGAEPSYLSLNSCTSADMLEASDAECDVEKLVRRDAIVVICVVFYVCWVYC